MKKILLDENLPRPLGKLFSEDLEVVSVHDIGWAEKKNGHDVLTKHEAGKSNQAIPDADVLSYANAENYALFLLNHSHYYFHLSLDGTNFQASHLVPTTTLGAPAP